MVFQIVIAGESQCEVFAEACLVADYLKQQLPSFCYEIIEKPILDWEQWLKNINIKNGWHHTTSPLVWREIVMKGSKPYYIGGGSEFFEFCHSYYRLDLFFTPEKFASLNENFSQYRRKLRAEKTEVLDSERQHYLIDKPLQKTFTVAISGVGHPIAMHLITGLLQLAVGDRIINRIFISDDDCSKEFMESVEKQCSYVGTDQYGKVVKYVDKTGHALAITDMLIILDHVPFEEHMSIGEWLRMNYRLMTELSFKINASAQRKLYVILPNLGPACYNATILSHLVNINKSNIAVVTSDLGLEICTLASEIAEVPTKYMFCPPVWGFVGINHLVDINTTVHRYCSFEPYKRYTRVKNSTLMIGALTPELRTMEYLMYFDDTLWKKVAENKPKNPDDYIGINKVMATVSLVKIWLFERDPNTIVCIGTHCNGSFGLHFNGVFSQPCRFVDGFWTPAADYIVPKDPIMSLKYLEQMAEFTMTLRKNDLPPIVPYYPCSCKPKYKKKKEVW